MTLRSSVARQMVRFHEIPLALAEEHTAAMDREELRDRFKKYWRRKMLQCPICLQSDAPLVRDHDHATGFSRGKLCRPCNSWLGVLEKHPEHYYLRTRPTRWRRWVYENAERIHSYLSQPPSGIWHSERVRRKVIARDVALGVGCALGPTPPVGAKLSQAEYGGTIPSPLGRDSGALTPSGGAGGGWGEIAGSETALGGGVLLPLTSLLDTSA